MSEAWTVRRAILWTAGYLERTGADSPRTDADVLLADALGVDRVRLLFDFDKPLSPEELAAYRVRIERRAAGEPTAYILGRKEFHGRDFLVDSRVLIPRPETEELVAIGLRSLAPGARVLDLCAGSGCVGLTIAAEREDVKVDLVELDPGAAEVARANAEKLGVADRCRILVGDLFAPVLGEPPYQAIVSNPPYVPSAEIPGLSREVRREPKLALDGGPDGLDLVRRIAIDAPERIVPGGLLALELTIEQPRVAVDLFVAAGFAEAHVEQDFTRRDRFLVATR
ncbi:peptide chain release factor N(5)-glutamine methyltransferase [Vulgatibacter incomptus]|uniref:Release factor glutamine methyltransferase n=1 Tax=Vulgatibacter incomptus TaxID=1391653 RepID=A0A0K1PEJ2_9BACT|nr:peptide chain release factor N(5)-glutamine methyltransferase [Vulgatibacter incomptus]AKU91953.1 Protein-N(5)-glutamine methyltransferase PrmC [Vulgatibacter incomptus]